MSYELGVMRRCVSVAIPWKDQVKLIVVFHQFE